MSDGRVWLNGTEYKILKSKTMATGTAYDLNRGKTLVNGTAYNIIFTVNVTAEMAQAAKLGFGEVNITIDETEYEFTNNVLSISATASVRSNVTLSGSTFSAGAQNPTYVYINGVQVYRIPYQSDYSYTFQVTDNCTISYQSTGGTTYAVYITM